MKSEITSNTTFSFEITVSELLEQYTNAIHKPIYLCHFIRELIQKDLAENHKDQIVINLEDKITYRLVGHLHYDTKNNLTSQFRNQWREAIGATDYLTYGYSMINYWGEETDFSFEKLTGFKLIGNEPEPLQREYRLRCLEKICEQQPDLKLNFNVTLYKGYEFTKNTYWVRVSSFIRKIFISHWAE